MASRFTRTIEFPNYSVDELVTITTNLCRKHYYELTDDAHLALVEYFERVPKDDTFGNGRVARKLFESMVNNQASRLAVAPPAKDSELSRFTAADLGAELAQLRSAPSRPRGADPDPAAALAASRAWRRLSGLSGNADVKAAVGRQLLGLAEARAAGGAIGASANVAVVGPPGVGRSTLTAAYAQGLAELGVVDIGHVVRVGMGRELRADWPGQAELLLRTALDDAAGGVLAVDVDGEWAAHSDDHDLDVLRALAAALPDLPADPVVVLLGTPDRVARVRGWAPGLAESVAATWALRAHTDVELADAAARALRRRGHEVPDEVRAALVDRVGPGGLAAAQLLAARLSAAAASRTLTEADVRAAAPPRPAGEGLTAVG